MTRVPPAGNSALYNDRGSEDPETVGLILVSSSSDPLCLKNSLLRQQPSHFSPAQTRVVSRPIDITRTTAAFSRDYSLVFVILLDNATAPEDRISGDNLISRQECVLGAIADTFGQNLWARPHNATALAAEEALGSQHSPSTTGALNLTSPPSRAAEKVKRQTYVGRVPCKSELHYISIPGKPDLQPVVSVHNVHTLVEPIRLGQSDYTPTPTTVSPSVNTIVSQDVAYKGASDKPLLSSILDSLYAARPSFVSPIDGLQVMKDVYRLVELASEHDSMDDQLESREHGSAAHDGSLTSNSDSELMRERDQQCWASVRHAVEVIEEAVRRYGPNAISLSFNGGKDCTVILHLFVAVLYRIYGADRNIVTTSATASTIATPSPLSTLTDTLPQQVSSLRSIQSIYVTHSNPFGQVESFVDDEIRRYNLDLVRIPGPMKKALEDYNGQKEGSVKAIMVGTRRDDPHGGPLKPFTMCDPSWPPFMRIHPILDWTYHDVWIFLRAINVPYCGLYDLGYTSLGGKDDTFPNPQLRRMSVGPFFDSEVISQLVESHLHNQEQSSADSAASSTNTSHHQQRHHTLPSQEKETTRLLEQLHQVDKRLDRMEEEFLFGPAWKLSGGESERCGRAK
ncbi:3'-phosphoadenosine 5'-phosphosulfate sulfotransferase [Lunasporangiospora selenospora]|uniref:FAD synthase n=1 Tax=Lunasporangiospora selenospora TaxID=979761 RepID=A0A9P6FXL1_9FUNG|nr:3'-phosphoadenosine 5'-phosphosulfate sulfotransferase [Lunasporangiospora selenospora]